MGAKLLPVETQGQRGCAVLRDLLVASQASYFKSSIKQLRYRDKLKHSLTYEILPCCGETCLLWAA